MSFVSFSVSEETLERLRSLAEDLGQLSQEEARLGWLKKDPVVQRELAKYSIWLEKIELLSCGKQVIVFELFAMGRIDEETSWAEILLWLEPLVAVERFYWERGGIVAYQVLVLERIYSQELDLEDVTYFRPEGVDLAVDSEQTRNMVLTGIASLPYLAEIYPVGGAADRLQFLDPLTQNPLPAALLPFLGHSLLEKLIRDVQGREYLYYQMFGKQLEVPIALMTSGEKGNHEAIVRLCHQSEWFGRDPLRFLFFQQPLVPMVDKEGNWCQGAQKELLLRPGGHGALWKTAYDAGVFDKLVSMGAQKILIRQINNPVSGLDHGLLGFVGVGCTREAAFGFASCPRLIGTAEGVDVLIRKKTPWGLRYCLTSIEYCRFSQAGIHDIGETEGGLYSLFPSNTNILFGDIAALQKVIAHNPIPASLLNFKKICYTNDKEENVEEELARVEAMMQNIADYFVCDVEKEEDFSQRALPVFVTYNERSKTISTAKRGFLQGGSLLETPQGCYLDMMATHGELLSSCRFQLPDEAEGIHFLYHPALGPLYSVIQSKLQGGKIAAGSELELLIAACRVQGLDLSGSFRILATHVMGHLDATGKLIFSEKIGRCSLKNVTIRNIGIDQERSVLWKHEVQRFETCTFILEGESELIGEDLIIHGNCEITVPSGKRARLFMHGEVLQVLYEDLGQHQIEMRYVTAEKRIVVEFCK